MVAHLSAHHSPADLFPDWRDDPDLPPSSPATHEPPDVAEQTRAACQISDALSTLHTLRLAVLYDGLGDPARLIGTLVDQLHAALHELPPMMIPEEVEGIG